MHDVTEAYDEMTSGKNAYQWPGGLFYFKDESGSWGDHELDHISPLIKKPYLYWALRQSKGLTKAGLARLNQSIEAFVYTILGAQVNTRSSIVGDSRPGLWSNGKTPRFNKIRHCDKNRCLHVILDPRLSPSNVSWKSCV